MIVTIWLMEEGLFSHNNVLSSLRHEVPYDLNRGQAAVQRLR